MCILLYQNICLSQQPVSLILLESDTLQNISSVGCYFDATVHLECILHIPLYAVPNQEAVCCVCNVVPCSDIVTWRTRLLSNLRSSKNWHCPARPVFTKLKAMTVYHTSGRGIYRTCACIHLFFIVYFKNVINLGCPHMFICIQEQFLFQSKTSVILNSCTE